MTLGEAQETELRLFQAEPELETMIFNKIPGINGILEVYLFLRKAECRNEQELLIQDMSYLDLLFQVVTHDILILGEAKEILLFKKYLVFDVLR